MNYLNIKGTDEVFVLFHGTGGNDTSLLGISGELDSHATVISFEGNVGVGINRRFFAPLVQGKIDREDLEIRVNDFLKLWDSISSDLVGKNINFVGYSNGANFIMALLEKRPDIANRTFLLHPSNLDWKFTQKAQNNKLIITLGAKDGMAPAGNIVKLVKEIEGKYFDNIQTILLDDGHAITEKEIKKLKEIY